MALIRCTECGTEISDKAAACVKCGAPVVKAKAAPSQSPPKPVPLSLILTIVVVGIGWLIVGNDKPAAPAAPAAAESKPVAAKEPECAKTDLQCLGDKGVVSAGVYCQDEIERLAKHSVRWTDGFLETKFSRFRWKDKEAGIITYIGNKAEFQNGFGAFTPVIYECDLSADNKTVLDARVREGRLPS